MSMFVAALMFVALLALAIACFLWSLGRTWPIRDRALLANAVVGVPGVTRVPKLAAFLVALFMIGAGVFALALADHASGGLLLNAAGVVLAAVFLARGVVGYTSWWVARTPVEPFRTLDRKNYVPLALALGAGFLLLVVMRLI